MSIAKLEIKRSFKSLLVWSFSISGMLVAFMLLFPQMKTQLESLTIFNSQLGKVFGMDKLSVSTSIGYFANMSMVITVAGAIFACLISISAVSNEEKNGTVEYLLSHPVSRKNILIQKFISIVFQITIFNLVCIVCSFLSFLLIGDSIDSHSLVTFFIGLNILHIELASICFFLSTIKMFGAGIGIGVALIPYFLNSTMNLNKNWELLGVLTQYKIADFSDIFIHKGLDVKMVILSIIIALLFLWSSLLNYSKKDITV
ncbi:ABC transporter permease subunit [Helcococcus ovis]|uniref:ABC transporter permease subunit n=1 Tax=Helcococcus ovis TaxID=72026 RepID=UPI0038BD437A